MNAPSGFLNIDKPRGITSHDVVNRVRRAARAAFGVKLKVGHAGTLDPMATGVLIVCLGAATRLSEYVMASRKQYAARVKLGESTDTYDADGSITAQRDAAHLTRADVEAAFAPFLGDILQMPPMYSAIKQDGRKLYDLARQGVTVERAARPVTIESLTLRAWQPPEFEIDVVCSAGTYIRSLAHDIGEALGVGAHLTALTRTHSGAFALADALSLDALDSALPDAWAGWVMPPQIALADWPQITLDADALAFIRQGRAVPMQVPADEGVLAAAFDDAANLAALVRAQGGLWQPYKVFIGLNDAE